MSDQPPPPPGASNPHLPPAPSQVPPPPPGSAAPPPPPRSTPIGQPYGGGPAGAPTPGTPWPSTPTASGPIPAGAYGQPAAAAAPKQQLGLGILAGLAAALVAGVAWYFIVTLSERQFVYLAVLFGIAVGAATAIGARRANAATAIAAAVIALVGIVFAYYFIARHAVNEVYDQQYGGAYHLGVFEEFSTLVKESYKAETSQYLFTGIAVVAAAVVGARQR